MQLTLALGILWLFAAYLLALGLVALARPRQAGRFLAGFAQTASANAAEAMARGLVGLSFVGAASHLGTNTPGTVIGMFLIATSVLMLLFPASHKALAARSVSRVAGHMRLLGLGSLGLAACLSALLLRPAL